MRCFRLLLIAGSVVLLAACAGGGGKLPEMGSNTAVLVEEYTMDVGDQVSINVWKNPELSISSPVRPDGKIAVPLVGDVMVAGKTPEALGAELEAALGNYIKEPNVTVVLTGLQGASYLNRITVTGAVGTDTTLVYHQGMTVLDAVLAAGSVNLYADANRTRLHRRTATGLETYNIRLKNILDKGDMTTNVYLQPGDVITVPESPF